MKFIYTIAVILAAVSLISWLNYRLICRFFRPVHRKFIKYIYLFFTMEMIFVLGYGWPNHLTFGAPQYEIYRFFVYCAVAWFGGQLILLLYQPIFYIAQRLIKTEKLEDTSLSPKEGAMTRRHFLKNTLAAASLVPFGISSKAVYEAQADLMVVRHSLVISKLPAYLKGFKICQISDTHLGPYFDLDKLDSLITGVIAEKPDLVVITGDFIDDLKLLQPSINRLNELHPLIPHGIYYCLGNHEYFQNISVVRTEFTKSRVKLLDNQSALLIGEQEPFYLMGVGYPWADISRRGAVSVSKRREYFAAAKQSVPANAFTVLIAHHPDFLMDGFAAQIPLTLTGHTHGGQVVVGGRSLLPTNYQYMRGLYQENNVYGYVSSGAGHWFPLRLNCPREISVFTLLT